MLETAGIPGESRDINNRLVMAPTSQNQPSSDDLLSPADLRFGILSICPSFVWWKLMARQILGMGQNILLPLGVLFPSQNCHDRFIWWWFGIELAYLSLQVRRVIDLEGLLGIIHIQLDKTILTSHGVNTGLSASLGAAQIWSPTLKSETSPRRLFARSTSRSAIRGLRWLSEGSCRWKDVGFCTLNQQCRHM